MVANTGYTPGITHFSCRVARCARRSDVPPVDIIAMLKAYAMREPGLTEDMGQDFARGHKQASGGIVITEQFERLWTIMVESRTEDSESPRKKRKIHKIATQKNTLEGWVKRT
jgi:hypothetical protein